MLPRILLTSFDIWKPHHVTNASDDLLAELLARNHITEHMHLMRKLPVDFDLAPQQVIAKINDWQPNFVICCGMAEKRSHLCLETNGKQADQILHTSIGLDELIESFSATVLSHDAGKFVCNHLYYTVLKYIQDHGLTTQCLFVHVPILQAENLVSILADFTSLLETFQYTQGNLAASSCLSDPN